MRPPVEQNGKRNRATDPCTGSAEKKHAGATFLLRPCFWRSSRVDRGFLLAACLLVACLLVACLGCGPTWNGGYTSYGNAPRSLNGTATFDDMLRLNGFQTKRTRLVTPRYDRVDTVIWFCESRVGVPNADAISWFERWLREKPGRTLVFVPRNYEADYEYWTQTVPLARPVDQWKAEGERGQAEKRRDAFLKTPPPPATASGSSTSGGTPSLPDVSTSEWVEFAKREKPLLADAFDGAPHWTDGINAVAGPLDVLVSMRPKGDAWTILLSGHHLSAPKESEPLVAVQSIGESRLILLQSGGFLLSGALVNREHRKLAGRLIAEIKHSPPGEQGRSVQPKSRKIVLLHMDSALNYRDQEEAAFAQNSPLVVLRMWPVAPLCWHIILLGIAYVFWRWPIFGRPRNMEETVVADFERHIDVYAELLAATNDRTYAYERIERYLRGGESGESEARAEKQEEVVHRPGD